MNKNVLLGKTIKAMYKLSGKTLTQIADETELTVDTINNLFYARIQKPGFSGVCALVKAMGFTIEELAHFMEQAEDYPADADITDAFTKFIFTIRENDTAAGPAPVEKSDNAPVHSGINEEHEHELDRYRATHLHYAEQIREQYKEQIEQMAASSQQLKLHYDHSIGEIKKAHAEELDRQEKVIQRLRSENLLLTAGLVLSVIVILLIVYMLKG